MSSLSNVNRPSKKEPNKLLRILGVGFGLAIIIGNTIGAGILRTPGNVAAVLPHYGLFMSVWVMGGIYALLGATAIAELGTTLPRSGGQYVFAHYALGRYAGFVVGWSDWISTCGTSALVSIVIAQYLQAIFPEQLSGVWVDKIIALSVVVSFSLLQWRGLRLGSSFQNITSLLKAIAFIFLVVACFIWGGETTDNINSFSPPVTTPLFVAIIIALQAVIYTYDGWAGVIYFSEEVRHPERSIPRAIFAGTLSVMGIYLLVNLALLYVLPITRIAGADLAAGVAAEVIWGKKADTIIRALTILSMLSSVNAYQLMATRVLFGMSRDQLFFHQAVKVNQGGTPSVALWISTAIAISFILSGTFNQVLAVLAFFFVASYTISFISLFVLRWREPQRARPYHAWGYPWTTALVLCGSVAFLIGAIISDTQNSVYALILLAVSYPIFCLFLRQ